jgi:endonuclease/exonuclease/phosphatase family metal-dependent hydrolase
MRTPVVLTIVGILSIAAVAGSAQRLQPSPVEAKVEPYTLSFVSLNMARESDISKILAGLDTAPRLRQADVFLLQEVRNEDGKPSIAEQMAQHLGYKAAFSPAAQGVYDQGLAIVSRYPIEDVRTKRLKYCDLRFHCRMRFALSGDVMSPHGRVRVWNAHLDTRINAGERLEQLQPVIDDAAAHPGPVVVGGDFNTNELRWIGNVVPFPGGAKHGQTIHRAMAANGFESPFNGRLVTFPAMRRHLDWIFVRDLKPVLASVEPVSFSDHHALWTRVVLGAAASEQVAAGE